jgi:serine/threonine protein phosphatase 1
MPLTYAIGDVHGRSDLLAAIIDFIDCDAARRRRTPRIIFLGDIVDRGHDSKGCLDIVGHALSDNPGSIFLRGNHDDWFLSYLEGDSREVTNWYRNGGMKTLASYADLDVGEALEFILRAHSRHLELLRRSVFMVDETPFAFVHAGIRPWVPVAEQAPKDLMCIRRDFYDQVGRMSHVVVHGHTIVPGGRPVVTENRISMDTGAYLTGRLSVMVLDLESDRPITFFQTDGDHRSVIEVEPTRQTDTRRYTGLLDDLSWLRV